MVINTTLRSRSVFVFELGNRFLDVCPDKSRVKNRKTSGTGFIAEIPAFVFIFLAENIIYKISGEVNRSKNGHSFIMPPHSVTTKPSLLKGGMCGSFKDIFAERGLKINQALKI